MDLTKFGFTVTGTSSKEKLKEPQNDSPNPESVDGSQATLSSEGPLDPEPAPGCSKNKLYEKKRKRSFKDSWRKTFDWVDYDTQGTVMYCSLCRQFPKIAKNNAMVCGVGGSKIRIRTLQEHASTKSHLDCVGAKSVQEAPAQAPIVSSFQNMDVAVREKLEKLFNCAYFVAKEEAPFTLFPKIVELHCKNGLDMGNTYRNDHGCRNFVKAIGESFMEDKIHRLKNARFFSVMSDSSMDRSSLDQELIYVRHVFEGKPVNCLVAIVSLEHAHAQGILDAIIAGLEQIGLNNQDLRSRLVGFGADGASVMMGKQNGVAAKLKDICPWVVAIHCVAHRLELSALDAVKHIPLLKEVNETLHGIFKHYSYSAKAARELKTVAEALGINILKPVNAQGTRWLPHMSRALCALVQNYSAIMVHFENHASDSSNHEASAAMKGRARLVRKSLSSHKMLLFIHFLLDVLDELKVLSLLFQQDDVTLQMVADGLQRTTVALVAMRIHPGPKLAKFIETIEAADGRSYQEVPLTCHSKDVESFEAIRDRLINSLCDFITSRFGNLEEGVLKASQNIFNTVNWPDKDAPIAEVASYGQQDLNVFLDHFKDLLEFVNGFSADGARREWPLLKVMVYRHFMHVRSQTLWQRLLQGSIAEADQFPNFKVLLEIHLVYPMSTACCERGFSAMKRVKSDWRSSLSNEMLGHLLQISMEGPSVTEFSPINAISRWWISGKRTKRPQFGQE